MKSFTNNGWIGRVVGVLLAFVTVVFTLVVLAGLVGPPIGKFIARLAGAAP